MDDPRELPEIPRLQWQCRRGMLELDLILEGFLETRYGALPADQKADFVRLLELPDPLLHDWLMGFSVPRDEGLRRLVALMRR